jgi:intracellular sulfur oxidation DsrE/DsrF family protein
MRTLQIIDVACRATLEEQDDPVLRITHAMRGAGADLAVLLTGNAVNYAVAAQDASGLKIGSWRQTHPPRVAGDLAGLLAKGVRVFAVAEDFGARGIPRSALIEGVDVIPRGQISVLLEQFPRIWHW